MGDWCAAKRSTWHWEAAYPNPVVANDHDSSGYQIFGNLAQVGQNDGIRGTDGEIARKRESRPPKSVSADTRTRSSV